MKKVILGFLASALLAAPMAASADVSGAWKFEFAGYSGAFSFTDLDTSQSYFNSNAGGFSITTNFDTSGGVNAFTYYAGFEVLEIGRVNVSSVDIFPAENDWAVWNIDLSSLLTNGSTTGRFQYAPIGADSEDGATTVQAVASVPEPSVLALAAFALLGVGLTRRRR